MDNKQAQQTITDVLEHAFDWENFTHLMRNLLNNIEIRDKHYSGNLIPEAYREDINQYWRVGKYSTPDNEEIDILIVEVKNQSKLDRARTTLRNFAINRLKQFEKEYSLIAFYSKEDQGADWRFSFIKMEHEAYFDDKGKVKTKTDLTPAKRYSFLVGEHESAYTACKQLLPLLEADVADPSLQDIENAFSIEKVTDEFFQQYKELYIKLSEHLKTQSLFQSGSEEEQKQKVTRFAKKLLGQIVFLYFLQKKGWLGVAKDEPWGKGDKKFLSHRYQQTSNNYYADFLQYLFYEALAQEREKDGYYPHFDCKIPFLNGGLFEADYDWKQEPVEIPDALFRNTEKNKAGDTGTGILDVFDRYNFTIKEDEPLEKEVAVDPEMLGKVFENMLEVTERKSKGAFYTPREIVHYMCQESLIQYLYQAVPFIPKTDLETFVRNGHLFLENDALARQAEQKIASGELKTTTHHSGLPDSIHEHADLLDEKLTNIKICDPAIGSGAFPVGLLHEIVTARLTLQSITGSDVNAYELKRHCIQESIYGVDIDASAIDISRLRLWLSLIVDESNYDTITALPNLDYKIMQGNSLVEDFDGIQLFNDDFINQQDNSNAEIEELKKQREQLGIESRTLYEKNQFTPALKDQIRKKNTAIDKKITNLSAKHIKHGDVFDLVSEAKLKAEKLEKLHKDFFSACTPVKKSEIRAQISILEWELIEATLKERNQTDVLEKIKVLKQSNEKPFFLWKLNFPEVFKQHGGFDVVIGNPPYVQIQKFSGQQIQKDLEKQNYSTFAKTGDIYCLFYEKANQLLKDNGISTFITSNKWMRANYGKKLRNYFLSQVAIHQLIDFGDSPIFKEATTYTNIMLFSKSQDNIASKAWDVSQSYLANTSLETMLAQAGAGTSFFNEDGFVIVAENLGKIKKRIEAVGTPLKKWDVSICRGILTGFNEAFIIEGKKKDELIAKDPKSAEIIKPILRGRDIKRYQASFSDLWFINSHNGYDGKAPIRIDSYSAIKEYLDSFLDKITKRYDKGVTPYNLRNCAYQAEFGKEKIVYAEIVFDSAFYYDNSDIYAEATAFILTGEKTKYLTALLNSRLLTFAFRAFYAGGDLRGSTFRYKKIFLENLPIVRDITDSKRQYFEKLVDYIQCVKLNELKLQTAYFEQLIDGLVFELYFTEEMNQANRPLLKHLGELKPITEEMTTEEKLAIIQAEFDRLYDPSHLVRNHLETLDSIEEIRIIKEALQ